jgi:hypothetical protein
MSQAFVVLQLDKKVPLVPDLAESAAPPVAYECL